MNCPECKYPCSRDEVNIGVGTQYGPWQCNGCGWSESDKVNEILAKMDEASRCRSSEMELQVMTNNIDAMTDAELVAAIVPHMPKEMDLAHRFGPASWWRTGDDGLYHAWDPLRRWDDTFDMVAAMRAKGWRFQMTDVLRSGEINIEFVLYDPGTMAYPTSGTFSPSRDDAEAQRRAILTAAAKAMKEQPS